MMLTIKKRLLLSGAVTMASVLIALAFFLSMQLKTYSRQQALREHLALSEKIVNVIFALQRERGETTGYLVEGAEELRARVQTRRELADVAMADFLEQGMSKGACFQRLTDFRAQVAENAISGLEAFDFYSQCIESLLNELILMRPSPGEAELIRFYAASLGLLHAMEHVGRLRAMVYMYIFQRDEAVDFDFQRFVLATDLHYQEALAAFRRNAEQDVLEIFDRDYSPEYIQEVFELAKRITSGSSYVDKVSPAAWFENSTQAVDLIRSATQEINGLLMARTQTVIDGIAWSIASLSIFFAAVLLLILYLTWTTIRSILNRLGNLLFGIEQITHTDDLSLRIASEGKDELAVIAGEFNKMMDSIESLMREKELQARQDPLTEIGNRLFFNESMDRELVLAQRYARSFSLILFDIDKFKHVNDQYGHDKGDHVLRTMARLVSSAIRKTDVFARWGGEEFVILTPETDLRTAVHLAEKLRVLIERHEIPDVGRVTVSFGVTTLKPGDDADALLKRADQALLAAKNNGRNRVESFEANTQGAVADQ